MPTISQIDRAIRKYQDDIQLIQDDWVISNNRFKQIKLGEFQGLDFIQVHEYLRPDGLSGYVIIIRADEPDGEYYKNINVGIEDERSRDWGKAVETDL